MSVAVCRGPAMPAFEPSGWLRPAEKAYKPEVAVDDRPAQLDIWNAIQADVDKVAAGDKKAAKPYVHPLVRRSSSLMSQKSLEICTESLGSETGSGDFTASLDDMASLFGTPVAPASKLADAEESFWQQGAARGGCEQEEAWGRKELVAVNYHCSGGTRSPPRSFPPPLPSMSSRDRPCLQMRPRRQDGRLIVDAVVVRPRGYLNARRQGGRLVLSFVDCSAREQSAASMTAVPAEAPYFPVVDAKHDQNEELATEVEEEDEVEEEEVEVVDRGTVVEVKVSTQPQTPTAAKVHRSTLVINKFVGSTPLSVADQPRPNADAPPEPEAAPSAAAAAETADAPPPTLRRVPSSTSTTTLAAAVAVASTSTDADDELHHPAGAAPAADTKQLLLFTSRCRDKQELLQSVRQCRQLRQKPLFILEPYCIATS
ncbi:protein FAF-like, chloroplastic [Oryza brachyantha]|uniref:protein FAF-like, chloroplastic n=1 Tax=Oryza brachyantha TaxID=4533 RepID=UPI001ADB3A99|nr:protein FAF-like, chloroplastic [Oryza brachyantha]